MIILLKILFFKLFRVKFVLHEHKLDIAGKDVEGFGLEEWKSIASMFSSTPGLKQTFALQLRNAIKDLDNIPKKNENFGEIVAAAQKVVELSGYMTIPEKAAEEVQKIFAAMKKEQVGEDETEVHTQNLM